MSQIEVVSLDSDQSLMDKYDLVSFFEYRSYRQLISYEDIIESDLVESVMEQKKFYSKQGKLAGISLTFLMWDTLLRKTRTVNKLLFGYLSFYALKEAFWVYHINEIYDPLFYVYKKYYALKAK